MKKNNRLKKHKITLSVTVMKYFPALAVLILPAWSYADTCNALINAGLYNTSISSSATDAQSMAKSTFCSSDYSNQSLSKSETAQIEASYGLFSGGAGGAASRSEVIAKQSQVCTEGFNSSKYSSSASSYSKTVYQGALDAWNKCQQLAVRGLEFSVQPSSTMQGITVSIKAPSGITAFYGGVTQYGEGTSDCTTHANNRRITPSQEDQFEFTAASTVTVTCRRNMIRNGDDRSADAQDLVFVTSMDNLTVPLPAIGSHSRLTSDQMLSQIQTQIRTTLSQSMSDLALMKNRLDSIAHEVTDATGNIVAVSRNAADIRDSILSKINSTGISRFQWSTVGKVSGMECININEPQSPGWADNYLCYSRPTF